jgi:ABC-type phosphate transport system substrate-binding protein
MLALVAPLSAADCAIKVIANSNMTVTHLSTEELKGLFLETRTSLADGTHVEPVFLRAGDAHDAFAREVTGKTTAGLGNYYRSRVFTGKGAMPRMFESEPQLVAYVRHTPGAIGYVSAGASTEGVRVLVVKCPWDA